MAGGCVRKGFDVLLVGGVRSGGGDKGGNYSSSSEIGVSTIGDCEVSETRTLTLISFNFIAI